MDDRIHWGAFIFIILVLIKSCFTWWDVKERPVEQLLPVYDTGLSTPPSIPVTRTYGSTSKGEERQRSGDQYIRPAGFSQRPPTAPPRHPPSFQAKVVQHGNPIVAPDNRLCCSERPIVPVQSLLEALHPPPRPLSPLRPPLQVCTVATEFPSNDIATSNETVAPQRFLDNTGCQRTKSPKKRRVKAIVNKLNAEKIFRQHNENYEDGRMCDFHGLRVPEAEEYLQRHLETCRQKRISTTRIITGRGKHTADGVARIRPRILALLEGTDDVRILQENVGDFLIKFV